MTNLTAETAPTIRGDMYSVFIPGRENLGPIDAELRQIERTVPMLTAIATRAMAPGQEATEKPHAGRERAGHNTAAVARGLFACQVPMMDLSLSLSSGRISGFGFSKTKKRC